MSKVFLSYSHKDFDFVEKLYQRLVRDGVECFFDRESIAWGSNWVIELEKGLDECDVVVLVLTPDYFTSEWTAIEHSSVRTNDPAGLGKKICPVLLEACPDLPAFLRPIQPIDISTAQRFEQAYPRICQELGGKVVQSDALPDRESLPSVRELPKQFRIPYRSLGNGFVGRVSDLWAIDDMLASKNTTVIEGVGVVMGTGGLGKTQLAIEYVHRFGHRYQGGVFWIDAEQGFSSFIVQITQAAEIEIDATLAEKIQLSEVWNKLSQTGPILLVLDNFPETQGLQPWLPPSKTIFTLVTTRRRDLNYARLPLNFMTAEEGLRLLNSGERQFGQEAGKLVTLLGGLPLALELTRNFLNYRINLSIDELLCEIEKAGEIGALGIFADKYRDELPSGHHKEVAATFQLSWDLATPHAKAVLECLCLLAPTPVPRRLLRDILNLGEKNALEDPVDDALSELSSRLSLVELDKENDPLMHRIIGAFIRNTMSEKDRIVAKITKSMADEMGRVSVERDISAHNELEKIIPHAEEVLLLEDSDPEQKFDLISYIQWHHGNWGRYRLAASFARRAVEFAEKQFDPGHPSIAVGQSNLALVLKDLGELVEARDLLRAALASDENTFESGHPSVALKQWNLSAVLKDLEELTEAKDLAKQAYQTFLECFGPDHSKTINSKKHWESI